jgi:hypothetical protein
VENFRFQKEVVFPAIILTIRILFMVLNKYYRRPLSDYTSALDPNRPD